MGRARKTDESDSERIYRINKSALQRKSRTLKQKEQRALTKTLRKEGDVPSLQLAKGKAQKEQRARLHAALLRDAGDQAQQKKATAEARQKSEGRLRDALQRDDGDIQLLHKAKKKATTEQDRRSRNTILRTAGDPNAIQKRKTANLRQHDLRTLKRAAQPVFKTPNNVIDMRTAFWAQGDTYNDGIFYTFALYSISLRRLLLPVVFPFYFY